MTSRDRSLENNEFNIIYKNMIIYTIYVYIHIYMLNEGRTYFIFQGVRLGAWFLCNGQGRSLKCKNTSKTGVKFLFSTVQ